MCCLILKHPLTKPPIANQLTAESMGIHVPAGTKLFGVLFIVIKGHLKLEDKRVLEIIYKWRVCDLKPDEEISQALLDIDEAAQVLERVDIEKLSSGKKEVVAKTAEWRGFQDDYIAKAREVTGAKPAVAKLLVPAHITQPLAKTMLPGGPKVTSIWLGKRGEWCGHCPPNGRITCTFAKHGSSEAHSRCASRAFGASG